MAAETKQRQNKPPKSLGRPKGSPNKTTGLLKDAILEAARMAGNPLDEKDPDGLVKYLQKQAIDTPGPFLGLMGKVLPLTLDGQIKINPLQSLLEALDGRAKSVPQG
jgi:hypothetical protein